MRTAELVITENKRKLVDASEVDFSDFKKVFKCSECDEIVKLRAGYWRENYKGNKPVWIRPTFVHDKLQLKDCSKRNSFGLPKEDDPLDLIARGQSTHKLEKAILSCFNASLKGDVGSRIYHVEKQPYSYYRWLSNISLNTYIKRYINYNGSPGRVHDNPELLCKAAFRIISSSQAYELINQYIEALPSRITIAQAEEYLVKKEIVTGISIDRLVNQYCLQLASLFRYFQNGMREKAKRQFISSLLWVDSENLPILPHEIETAEARASRETSQVRGQPIFYRNKAAKALYLKQEKERQSFQIEHEQQSYRERIGHLPEKFLLDIADNRSSSLDEAFEDFRREEATLGCNLVKLILDRLISATSCTNWEKVPVFYEYQKMRYKPWEESWMTSASLKEIRKRESRKQAEIPLQNGEQLIKLVKSS